MDVYKHERLCNFTYQMVTKQRFYCCSTFVTVWSSQKVRENRNDNLGSQETLCTAHETKKNQNIKHNMTTTHAVK